MIEGVGSNGGESGRKCSIVEAGAGKESVIPNGGKGRGEGDTGESGAAPER